RITCLVYPNSLSYHVYSTTLRLSLLTMVALLSNTLQQVSPMMSLLTSSGSIWKWIWFTSSPFSAAWRINSFICSSVTSFFTVRFMMARDPFGVGTRTALAVSLSFRLGMALLTAVPAPVLVITILIAALRPRRGPLW